MEDPIKPFLFFLDGDKKFNAITLTTYARSIKITPKTIIIETMIGQNNLDYYNKYKEYKNQSFGLSLLKRNGDKECSFQFNNVYFSSIDFKVGHNVKGCLIAKIKLKYKDFDIVGNTDYNYDMNLLYQTFCKGK